MNLKNFLLPSLLLAALTFSGCVGQAKDDIFLNGNPNQSYGERYRPARAALSAGDFETLKNLMGINPTDEAGNKLTDLEVKEKLIAKSSELSLIERGLLTLNTGDYHRALLYFDAAEIKMEETDAQTKASKNISKAGKGTFAALTGMEESKDYYLRGYEKVMIYNYKALCYMLMGDRKAYNVTRKGIDKQQEEWELFKEQLAELEDRKSKRVTSVEKAEETENVASSDSEISDVIAAEDSRDKYTKEKAALVPNAYVNPFGDYMDAMILEIDSYDERSLRDNARIAYGKVVKNNKSCTTAKQAVADMRKRAPSNKKLVHVLLADGFSPEHIKKTAQFTVGDITATANYTEATPHPSNVISARVKVGGMTRTMSSLSRIESIILRDDLDRKPFKVFMMALAFARTAAVEIVAKESGFGSLGKLASGFMCTIQRPDTRTWLSLPNQILVARLYVPKNAKTLTLTTYGADKKSISTTEVALAKKGPSVIYAVNYGTHMQALVNESSWITK